MLATKFSLSCILVALLQHKNEVDGLGWAEWHDIQSGKRDRLEGVSLIISYRPPT